MKNLRIKIALAAVALVALAGASYATAQSQKNVFKDPLDGWQEDPSQVTTGFGEIELRIDDASQTITYRLTYAGLEGPAFAAHIHIGSRHETGGVSAFLCPKAGSTPPTCPPTAGTVTGVITATDVIGPQNQGVEAGNIRDLIRAIREGETYANVHTTTRAPGGEIRGQIGDDNQRDPQQ